MQLPEDPAKKAATMLCVLGVPEFFVHCMGMDPIPEDTLLEWYADAESDEAYTQRVFSHYGVDPNEESSTSFVPVPGLTKDQVAMDPVSHTSGDGSSSG